MTDVGSAIYVGQVVHKRLTPRQHGFTYRVFALALNVDQIGDAAASLRLFGRNRRGLVSFHDADHGDRVQVDVADQIRATLTAAGRPDSTAQIVLLCYPRLLGMVFNPLSVYFCFDTTTRLQTVVYEVSNTFGERTSYIIPVDAAAADGGTVHQNCTKGMYVSPFTPRVGQYGFHVTPPDDEVVVGVTLRDQSGPVLKTHFRGSRLPLTDRNLAAMMLRHPLMTAKVVGAIHVEAARLWLKGVPLVRRHTSGRHTIAVIAPTRRAALDSPGHLPGNVNV